MDTNSSSILNLQNSRFNQNGEEDEPMNQRRETTTQEENNQFDIEAARTILVQIRELIAKWSMSQNDEEMDKNLKELFYMSDEAKFIHQKYFGGAINDIDDVREYLNQRDVSKHCEIIKEIAKQHESHVYEIMLNLLQEGIIDDTYVVRKQFMESVESEQDEDLIAYSKISNSIHRIFQIINLCCDHLISRIIVKNVLVTNVAEDQKDSLLHKYMLTNQTFASLVDPDGQDDNPVLYITLQLIKKLEIDGYKKNNDFVVKQKMIDGFGTFFWENHMSIEDYVTKMCSVTNNSDLFKKLNTKNSRKQIKKAVIDNLIESDWFSFKQIKVCRNAWSFKDGIFLGDCGVFVPYEKAHKYVPKDFTTVLYLDQTLMCASKLTVKVKCSDLIFLLWYGSKMPCKHVPKRFYSNIFGLYVPFEEENTNGMTIDQLEMVKARQAAEDMQYENIMRQTQEICNLQLQSQEEYGYTFPSYEGADHAFLPGSPEEAYRTHNLFELTLEQRLKQYMENVYEQIQTSTFETILQSQNLPKDVRFWVYIMCGRCYWIVNARDNWQVGLFIIGKAGTGKSTMLNIIGDAYPNDFIGIISSKTERTFGLSKLENAHLVLCPELNTDLQLSQTDLNSMISGENMEICHKGKQKTYKIWDSHIACAGNNLGPWKDNSGATSRRVFAMLYKAMVQDTNGSLRDMARQTLSSFIVKSCILYKRAATKFGINNIWTVCPTYFCDVKRQLRGKINSIAAYLMSGAFTFEENCYMPFDAFKKDYKDWCVQNNKKNPVSFADSDNYESLFMDMGIIVREDTKIYKKTTVQGSFLIGIKPKENIVSVAITQNSSTIEPMSDDLEDFSLQGVNLVNDSMLH